ncbi:carbohydrate esterase family 16 protein [Hebeloma cylindrosporum]|uniref:Carbohydrate esterase family 16 protein n=1 Tax=Hebeloma cylindrosporum TaxID=76867 RepID=A0A0C2XU23_HEBCY|nr:carbohydrate esterase family 16 protein [Hebeloma cylindrosporum h7]
MKRNSDNRPENDLPETSDRLPKIRKVEAGGDAALVLSSHRAPMQWGDFEHIIVLGDSYSSDEEQNWVWFLRKRIPSDSRPTIRNFAKGGDTVEDDLTLQLERLFTRLPTAESIAGNGEVLVVIWLGINDWGRTDADELEPIVEQIFEAMHDLYTKWKARSFLLIDVPPMHRSPGGIGVILFMNPVTESFLAQGKAMGIDDERYTTWNSELLRQAKEFATDASKASVSVVSSYTIIADVLDDPESYGLSDCIEEEDSDHEDEDEDEELEDSDDDSEKPMWADNIHLSTAGHRVLADRLWTTFRK